MLELGWLASRSRAVPRAGSGSPPHPSASSGPHPVPGPVTLGGLCFAHRAALFFSFPSPIQGWRRPHWGGRVKRPAQPGLRPWPGRPRAVIASLLWQRDQGRAGGGGRRGWKRPSAPVGPQGLPARYPAGRGPGPAGGASEPPHGPQGALRVRVRGSKAPAAPAVRGAEAGGVLPRKPGDRDPFLSPPDRNRRGRSGPRPPPRDSERQRQGC